MIANILRNLSLGEGSISAFITADKRELLLRDDTIVKNSDFSFVQQSYYTEAMNEMAATIIDYVTYNGQQYLFMLSKSYQTVGNLCDGANEFGKGRRKFH